MFRRFVLQAAVVSFFAIATGGCTSFSIQEGPDAKGIPVYGFDTYLLVTQTTGAATTAEIKRVQNDKKILYRIKPEPAPYTELAVKFDERGLPDINGKADSKVADIIKAVSDAIPNWAKLFGAGAGIVSVPQNSNQPISSQLFVFKLQEDGNTWRRVELDLK